MTAPQPGTEVCDRKLCNKKSIWSWLLPIEVVLMLLQVLTANAAGETSFETVFMFSHQIEQQTSQFVTIDTVSGNTLKMTPGHYLWVLKQAAMSENTMANDNNQEAELQGGIFEHKEEEDYKVPPEMSSEKAQNMKLRVMAQEFKLDRNLAQDQVGKLTHASLFTWEKIIQSSSSNWWHVSAQTWTTLRFVPIAQCFLSKIWWYSLFVSDKWQIFDLLAEQQGIWESLDGLV